MHTLLLFEEVGISTTSSPSNFFLSKTKIKERGTKAGGIKPDPGNTHREIRTYQVDQP